jgi:hypothetical protein
VSVKVAAEELNVPAVTLYSRVRDGSVPSRRIGSKILIPWWFIHQPTEASSVSAPSTPAENTDVEAAVIRLRKLLASAPADGACALELTLRGGCITRMVVKTMEESLPAGDEYKAVLYESDSLFLRNTGF